MTSGQLEITPRLRGKARTLKMSAIALIMAVVMLAFCREINMFCFRAFARCENAALALHANIRYAAHAAHKSMLSQTQHSVTATKSALQSGSTKSAL